MVNTKLNSHEQNKKHTEIAKNNFKTFGENETKQEQFSRMSDLHTGPILAIYCIQLSHAIKFSTCLPKFSNILPFFSEKSYPCPYFLEQTLALCNSHLHLALGKTLRQLDKELVRRDTGGNKVSTKMQRKIKNEHYTVITSTTFQIRK